MRTSGKNLFDFLFFSKAPNYPIFGASGKPGAFQSPEAVIKFALEMEKSVTANIHLIHALATKESDPETQSLMNWFVTEQVEEEETFRDLLERVSAADNNRWFLLQLDKEMMSRQAAE